MATSVPPLAVDDDPCWGGPQPERHDLEYLLRVLASTNEASDRERDANSFSSSSDLDEYSAWIRRIRRRLILHEDDRYLAIDKPADLRMDGRYSATVHKLLLYLSPPPSLERMASVDEAEMNVSEKGGGDKDCRDATIPATSVAIARRHRSLLQSIAPLSKRNFLSDDPRRWVHQLDYATSGTLLVGKTREATSAACRAFEDRRTAKEYVAVVFNPESAGRNDPPPLGPDFLGRLPLMPSSCLESWGDGSLEERYRRRRRRDADDRKGKQGTFDGYMPVHSVFAKWRASLVRERKADGQEAADAAQRTGVAGPEPAKRRRRDYLPALPRPMTALTPEEIDELLSVGPSYKRVKSYSADKGRGWSAIVEAMAEEYNRSLADFYAKEATSQQSKRRNWHGDDRRNAEANLPPLFRIQEDERNSGEWNGACVDTFYICAPIGESKDSQFHVVVDPAACPDRAPQSPLPELRPSLTKCTVLWRGRARSPDVPAAKVLLRPWTGRRHQLRVHLARVVGCPILGDATYGEIVDAGGNDARRQGAGCDRMCLHAKKLTLMLVGEETMTFTSPDPFVVAKADDGKDESLLIADIS